MKILKSFVIISSTVLIVVILLLSIFILYRFNFIWNIRHFALVGAIPITITALLALTSIYLIFKKNIWYAGLIVIAISSGTFAFFFTQLSNSDIGPLMSCQSTKDTSNQKLSTEEEILRTIFVSWNANDDQDGTYVYVSPDTEVQDPNIYYRGWLPYLNEEMSSIDPSCSELLDRFFEINKTSTRLSLDSSIEEGYVIDYENEFETYFTDYNDFWGNWDRWRSAHPNSRGINYVSWPAYDPETGFVIVYIGGFGQGELYLYQYKNCELVELKVWTLWIF